MYAQTTESYQIWWCRSFRRPAYVNTTGQYRNPQPYKEASVRQANLKLLRGKPTHCVISRTFGTASSTRLVTSRSALWSGVLGGHAVPDQEEEAQHRETANPQRRVKTLCRPACLQGTCMRVVASLEATSHYSACVELMLVTGRGTIVGNGASNEQGLK
jgi:hypothetical protein